MVADVASAARAWRVWNRQPSSRVAVVALERELSKLSDDVGTLRRDVCAALRAGVEVEEALAASVG